MKDIEGIEKVLQVLEPHWKEIEADFAKQNARFLELAAADHDQIGRVLRAHLVIESFMTGFLEAHYRFEELGEANLSFYQKARLLPLNGSPASFVRPGIIHLNRVRNKFGHELQHQIEHHEISGIYEALKIARAGTLFESPIDAIEAFGPIACAFLSVPPKHLQKLFMEAFADVSTYTPEM